MGKAVIITGATSGIGFSAAKEFARLGMAVIGIGRSEQSCRAAVEEIWENSEAKDVTYISADLSSLDQVRKAAEEIISLIDERYNGRIDVLVNNAGTFSDWYIATEDGYEMQFAVNYLSHFLLTNLLISRIGNSEAGGGNNSGIGRVLNLSSGSHYHTRMHWNDIMYRKHYNCLMAYKQSKLAAVLFSNELNRKFAGRYAIRAYAVDPGLVNTAIGEKRTGLFVKWFWKIRRKRGVHPDEAARTILYLAMEENLIPDDAVYWKDCCPKEPSRISRDKDESLKLWNVSEKLCGITRGNSLSSMQKAGESGWEKSNDS